MTETEKQIRELSDKAFANHTITERMRCGVFRSWRCQKPGTRAHLFDITTIPGSLIITGDVGDLIVTRTYDMLPWCRGSVDDTRYFAEKVPQGFVKREFSLRCFEQWADDILESPDVSDADREIVREAYRDRHDCGCDHLYSLTRDVWIDGPPDWTDWTPGLLWCRDAIRWFVTHHSEPEVLP